MLAHLGRHRLAFAEDPSNADPRFTRVRVRRELIPLLLELSPGIIEHLGALADMLAAERAPVGAPSDPALPLGRAQRQAVDRALRLGKKAVRLRVRGGREVEVTFPEGRIVLTERE